MPIEYFSEITDGHSAAPPPPSIAAGEPPPATAAPAPQGRSVLVFIDDVFSVAQRRDTVLKEIEKGLPLLRRRIAWPSWRSAT